ncbi:hypothetical protein [Streptomyces pinistramenti]|uniref:hypothetical protein n=1 Tax=Streptomyces pinistramenti TaxID=2884812 RepID=UPI00355778D2
MLAPVALLAAQTYVMKKAAQLPERMPGWTLYVGRNYIVTTDATGRREFTWDRLAKVTVGEIPHRGAVSVHRALRGVRAEIRPAEYAPAGWPHPKLLPPATTQVVRTFPVCVLGPMTHAQRTELSEALARYGGSRWSTPEHAAEESSRPDRDAA